MSCSVDRQALVEFILKGGQDPATTFTSPGNFGAVLDGVGIGFDPAQARAWLSEAGFPNGEGLGEITLSFNTGANNEPIAEAIASMWLENLGVQVNLLAQEFQAYIGSLFTDPTHIWTLTYGADYPDADNWLRGVMHSQSPFNFGGFSSGEFDAAVEQAAGETDQAVRVDLYRQAERILTEEVAAMLPLFHGTTVVLTKPYLERTFAPFGGDQLSTWTAFGR